MLRLNIRVQFMYRIKFRVRFRDSVMGIIMLWLILG